MLPAVAVWAASACCAPGAGSGPAASFCRWTFWYLDGTKVLGTESHLLSLFWPGTHLSGGENQGPGFPCSPRRGANIVNFEPRGLAGVSGDFTPAFPFENPFPEQPRRNHQADKRKMPFGFQGVDSPLAAMSAAPSK